MISREEAIELVKMAMDPDAYPEHEDEIFETFDACAEELMVAYAEGRLVELGDDEVVYKP